MKANEKHYFSNLFYKLLYMFRTCPLSIIRSISTLYTTQWVFVMLVLLASASSRQPKEPTWQIPIALYTVLRYSWWWTVDMSETCKVIYQINLRSMLLVGFYYKNIPRWLVLWMSKKHLLIKTNLPFRIREAVRVHDASEAAQLVHIKCGNTTQLYNI